MWRALLVLVLPTALMSGCVATDVDTNDATVPSIDVAFACPEGPNTWRPSIGTCAVAVGRPEEARAEPSIAVDDPGGLVVIATNAWRDPEQDAAAPEEDIVDAAERLVTGDGPPEPPSQCDRGYGACLAISNDSGETWQSVPVPLIAGRHRSTADVMPSFGPDGRLHLVGLYAVDADIGGLFHAVSGDSGATWATASIIEGAGQDRPWFTWTAEGELLVTFQGTEEGKVDLGLARSTDGGSTWDVKWPVREGCNLQTRPVEAAARLVVACLDRTPGSFGTVVLAIDATNGTASPLARLPGLDGTHYLTATPAGQLVLVGRLRIDGALHVVSMVSDDGGGTWGPPTAITSQDARTAQWDWRWPAAVEVDASGLVHMLIVGGPGEPCLSGTCRDPDQRRQVVHFVVDPGTGTVLRRAKLSPPDGSASPPWDRSVEALVHGEFEGIAPTADGVWLAWGHGGRVEAARLVVERTV